MAYSSYNINEEEVIQPSLSWASCEYEGVPTNDDHLPLDATFYACPFFDSCSCHQQGLLQAMNPSPCWEEESDFPTSPWNRTLETEAYEEESQPYNGCRNWLSNCHAIFNGCSEDNHDYLGNESNNNLENTEISNKSEEECDVRSFTHRDGEDTEDYPAASDYDIWSCCDSWLAYGRENESLANSGEETDIEYERVLGDTGVYEGIFGYWPCLYHRH